MVVVVVTRLCRHGPFSTKAQRVSFVGYTGGEGGKFSFVEPTKPTRCTSVRYGGCSLKVTLGSEGFYHICIRSGPRTLIRPHFSVPLSLVRFLLPAFLSAPNATLYSTRVLDYYTIITSVRTATLHECL